MSKPIAWKRALNGYIEDRSRRWRVYPVYCGCVRPHRYELSLDLKRMSGWSTQRAARAEAERIAHGWQIRRISRRQ